VGHICSRIVPDISNLGHSWPIEGRKWLFSACGL